MPKSGKPSTACFQQIMPNALSTTTSTIIALLVWHRR